MLHQWFTCLSVLTGGCLCVSLSTDAGDWIAAGEALIRELGQDNITLYWVCVECLGWHAGAVEMVLSGWGIAWTQPR